jgi:pSer/pThr/pTyr-binding forkhead associated (FHA) protein
MVDAYLEDADLAGQVLAIKGISITVGSGSGCDILIKDRTVSRRHAILKRFGSDWAIEDLGSTNGTWVNGRRVAGVSLTTGDHIALGSARFFFNDGRTSSATERRDLSSTETKRLLDSILALPPYDFEKLTGKLFASLGFESIVTKATADGGVDVVAVNNGVIFRGKYLIQCKRYSQKNKVARPEVVAFFGRIASEPGARGFFVTSSSFTRGAREFAQATGINLIDGEELERLVLRHRVL